METTQENSRGAAYWGWTLYSLFVAVIVFLDYRRHGEPLHHVAIFLMILGGWLAFTKLNTGLRQIQPQNGENMMRRLRNASESLIFVLNMTVLLLVGYH